VSGWLGTLQLAALVAALAALAAVIGAALAYPWLRSRARRLAPEARVRLLAALCAAPLALPALALSLCLLPSLLAALGLHADHCPRHAEHLHLCVTHRPPPLPLPWSLAAGLGAVPAVGALALGAVFAGRSRRLRRSLERMASGALRGDVRLVEASLPLCVTAGLLRPRIFVSERFAAALPQAQLEVALEHECAHVRRRDGLRKLAAAALSWPHLPALRRRLLGDLSLACEQACDARAARCCGDRLRVAEAILAAERLAGGAAPGEGCAFGGSTLPERVLQLLDAEPPPPLGRLARRVWLGVAAAAALALADPLHHLAEHALALLLR
jgi:hypothetical protein